MHTHLQPKSHPVNRTLRWGISLLFLLTYASVWQATQVNAQTVPIITSEESVCQASGVVQVVGDSTYLNFLTGSTILPIGPLSGDTVVFELLPPGSYEVTQINPANNVETKYPIVVEGNYKQNWLFTAESIFSPCNAGTPTVAIGNFTITSATVDEQRPDYFFRISAKNGSLPADGTEPPAYSTPLNGSFPIPYPSGLGGTYEIQAIDQCGNYKTINVQVPSAPPAPTVSSTFVKFNNCDGDADYRINASGGTSPYTFTVKSGPDQVGTSQTGTANAIFTLTTGGTYVFTVMDQCGGTKDITVTPKNYVAPTTSIGTSNGECGPDGGTGSIRIITVADGIGPFTYSITSSGAGCSTNITANSASTDTTFAGLPRPCTYVVNVTDGCGKVSTQNVELTAPGPEALGCNMQILCPSGTSEEYRLSLSVVVKPPYTPTPNYTFVVTDSTTNTVVYTRTQSGASVTTTSLPAGKYYISITDDCGATCTDSVIITTYQNPTVTVDGSNICAGSGQANVIGINNRSPDFGGNIYTYRIIAPSASKVNTGPEADSPGNTGQFSSLVSGGTYTFRFSDGCKNVTTTYTVPTYEQPTWEVGFGAICPPRETANLQVINLQPAGKVVGPYTWRITSTDSPLYNSTAPYNGTLPYPNSLGQTDSLFAGLPPRNSSGLVATYNIQGVDGCKNSFQGSGKIGILPEEELILDKTVVCADSSGTLRARPSIPVVDATYLYFRDGVKIAESTTFFTTLSPAIPGTYTMKVYPYYSSDTTCFKEASKVVTASGKLVLSKNLDSLTCSKRTINLTSLTSGSGAGTITYFTDKNLSQPVANASSVGLGTYYIKYEPAGVANCVFTDSVTIVERCKATLGDFVWNDLNDNGQQDPGEPGVAGIKVILWTSVNGVPTTKLDSIITPASGNYTFGNLVAGDYLVQVDLTTIPDTMVLSTKKDIGSDVTDSDFGANGFSQVVTLNPAIAGLSRNNPTIDVGLYAPTGSIGDFVFEDINGDGQQDGGDLPIEGVKVYLLDGVTGAKLDSTLTLANGSYLFQDLYLGSYRVQFVTPVNFDNTTLANVGNDTKDSDIGASGISHLISIDPFKPVSDTLRNNPNIDAGYLRYGSIGDFAFDDKNGDGIQDAGDAPLEGVLVYLLDGVTGAKLDSTLTNASGQYLFDSLLSGSYQIQFVTPTGYDNVTKAGQGGDGTKDSDLGTDGKSPVITLDTTKPTSDTLRNNPNVDGGFIKYGSLGDYVWFDTNADGQQGPVGTEPPIKGVTVYLLDGTTGAKLDSTLTEVDGKYLFDSLLTGTYRVSFVTPTGFENITVANSGDDTTDSDIGSTGQSHLVTIDTTKPVSDTLRNNPTVDAGFIKYGSIGDYVWQDTDNDGQQGPVGTEPPIQGVRVFLLDATTGLKLDSTLTGTNGEYVFDSLKSGSYKVQFIPPANTVATQGNQGDDTKDSDVGINGLSHTITIDITKAFNDTLRNNPQIDAGFSGIGSIGDFVFDDLNGNGSQDGADLPIEGVKVFLLDGVTGAKLDSTLTDSNGKYSFDSLLSGSYKVSFVTPVGFDNSTIANTGDDTLDSDIGTDGVSHLVLIDATKPVSDTLRNNPNVDAGFIKYGSIGDFAFDDKNGDGIQDAGDVPLEGVLVYLLDGVTGAKLDSTLTNASGQYLFDSLLSGSYQIQFVTPTGYDNVTKAGQGGDGTKDSDLGTDGKSPVITLDTTKPTSDTLRNNPNVDGGFIKYGSLGDYVWFDTNADGQQGPVGTEPPIKGVTVYLLDGTTGAKLDSTLTDIDGKYLFDSLLTGTYRVSFVTPAGFENITVANSGDDTTDSDIGSNGQSHLVTIDTTKPVSDTLRNNPTVDAGFIKYGSIGDYVWQDTDNDGQQGPVGTEPPIQGVRVFLLDATTGLKLDSTLTGTNGEYVFDSLQSGSYKVQFIPPVNTVATQGNQGDDTKDSDVGINGLSHTITIDITKAFNDTLRNNPQIDAGFVPLGSIGDFVFEDRNEDGLQNAGDVPIEGVKVFLLDGLTGVKLDSTLTDLNGNYIFDSLFTGSYQVQFERPAGFDDVTKRYAGNNTQDSNIDSTGKSQIINLDISKPFADTLRNNLTIDAGFVKYGSIGDFVWNDVNNDGQQDSGEPGVDGVKVILWSSVGGNPTMKLDSTVTTAGGKYTFDNLPKGDYLVQIVLSTLPDTLIISNKLNIGPDSLDNDFAPSGFSQTVTIDPFQSGLNRNNPTIDAGLFAQKGSIGDFVFEDLNGNGQQDPNDPPIEGVKVFLLDANTGAILDSTLTNSSGN